MAVGEMKQFPKGAVAMDSGDLIQVINAKLSFKNGLKLKHTLRSMDPVGTVSGPRECTVSFEFEIPAEGAEKDYFDLCAKGKVKQIRLKVPGKTYTVDGSFSSVDLDLPIDDAVKGSVEFMGRLKV